MSANDCAKIGDSSDSKSAYGTCPLKEQYVQFLPLRYALVEKKLDIKAISSKCSSHVKFRPIGVRPIPSSGHIYIWHPKDKNNIYSYTVDSNSAVKFIERYSFEKNEISKEKPINIEDVNCISVSKKGFFYVLYSRCELSNKLKNQIIKSEIIRKRIMQEVNVNNYLCGNGTQHLVSTSKINQIIADCNPNESDNNGVLNWCWVSEKINKFDTTKILSNIDSKYKKSSVLLLLEDPIGIMTELASAFLSVVDKEEQWYDKDNNRAKYFAAVKIKTLIEVGKKQFNEKSKNDEINRCISNDLANLKELYNKYTQAIDSYFDKVKTITTKSTYNVSIKKIRETNEFKVFNSIKDKVESYAANNNIESEDLIAFFMRVKQDNDFVREGNWYGLTGDRGVLDRIRYEDMTKWFKSAVKEINFYEDTLDQLDKDRVSMLRPAYDVIAIYDKESDASLLERLKIENHWLIQLGHLKETRDTARKFFFGEVGEQNLQAYISDDLMTATIENKRITAKDLESTRKKFNKVKSKYSDLKSDNKARENKEDIKTIQEYRNLLAGRHIVELENMSDKVKDQMNKLGSQFAKFSIIELQDVAKGIDKTQSIIDTMKPGFVVNLIGHKNVSGVKFEPGASVDKSDLISKFNQLNRSLSNYKNYSDIREYLVKNKKIQAGEKISELNKNIAKEYYNIRRFVKDLDLQVNPLSSSKETLPKGYLGVSVSNNNEKQVKSFLEERRKLLWNEFVYGNSEGFKIDKPGGVLKNGSLGLVLLYTSFNNFNNVINEYKQHSNLNGKDYLILFQSLWSLATSINSLLSQCMNFVAVRSLISDFNEVSIKNFAKVTSIANLSSSAFLSISSMTDSFNQSINIYNALRKGNIGQAVSSSLVLIGDGVQGIQSSKLLVSGIYKAYETKNWLTVSEFMQIGARVNPWTFFATVLIYGGSFLYNYFQSNSLMKWVSQCVWGLEDKWFVECNEHWTYKEQLLNWIEATQFPSVFVGFSVKQKIEKVDSNSIIGSNYSLPIYSFDRLQLVFPLNENKKIKVSAVLVNNKGSLDITNEILSSSMFNQQGLNSVYNINLSPDKIKNYQWLELMLEVKTSDGDTLFTEEGGLRYSINLYTTDGMKAVESKNMWYENSKNKWFNIASLDEDSSQLIERETMRKYLKELVVGVKE